MDGIRLIIDVDGVLPGDMLARLADGTADTLPLTTNIGSVLENGILERLQTTKTAPDGTPWAPNRAGTSILVDTGNLLGTVGFIAAPSEVEVGASAPYAHVHQEGAVIKPKSKSVLRFMVGRWAVFAREVTIPARPFVGVSAEDETEIERVTLDWLSDLVSGLPGGR
ncbi:phage virion morphogenesis protein [Ancylobacter dichloromethanicus]|uniref:Virion morphogenesis protein n=1 Tax=Ancylobacter dichloromethanicus TaxID=518825 RepID=A0A9W6JCD7_9HYPH|nr:phage virion morphogenesis protein [Ancylobacter dichloromethanicus]MBS7553709.1 phage virion morphogenesis protein [Ancylobacter dichloromethanicus]GLK74672.1 virion morphogenesis protein [Ancylobacter dichloromethanicus]